MAIKKAKIFTITSVKGGTGKTTTVLNLAGVFSKLEKKTLIIDFDLYGRSIAVSLDIDYKNDIYKLVNDIETNKFDYIENYISSYNENIDLLQTPKDPRFSNKINTKYIDLILSKLSFKYDVILIDTNYFLNDINLTLIDLSDQILYVITNDVVDLKNIRTMINIFKFMNKTNYKIILNDSINNQKKYISKHDIKTIVKDKISFIIPSSFYIRSIDIYVLKGKILTLDDNILKKHKNAIKVFQNICNFLLNDLNEEVHYEKNN